MLANHNLATHICVASRENSIQAHTEERDGDFAALLPNYLWHHPGINVLSRRFPLQQKWLEWLNSHSITSVAVEGGSPLPPLLFRAVHWSVSDWLHWMTEEKWVYAILKCDMYLFTRRNIVFYILTKKLVLCSVCVQYNSLKCIFPKPLHLKNQ